MHSVLNHGQQVLVFQVRGPLPEHRHDQEHGGEDVVQVVGYPAGQRADGLEPLRPQEFLLEQLLLGDIGEEGQPGPGPARGVVHEGCPTIDDAVSLIAGPQPELPVPKSVALHGLPQVGDDTAVLPFQQFLGCPTERLGRGPAEVLLGSAAPDGDLVGEVDDHHRLVGVGKDVGLVMELVSDQFPRGGVFVNDDHPNRTAAGKSGGLADKPALFGGRVALVLERVRRLCPADHGAQTRREGGRIRPRRPIAGRKVVGSHGDCDRVAHVGDGELPPGAVYGEDRPPLVQHAEVHGKRVDGRLGKAVGLAKRRRGAETLADVADVALDHLLPGHEVHVADKLHVDPPPVAGFQRKVLVADVLVPRQLGELRLVCDDVPEETEVPDRLPQELLPRETEEVHQEGVHVIDPPGHRVEDQDAVLGGLEEPPVAQLGCVPDVLEPKALTGRRVAAGRTIGVEVIGFAIHEGADDRNPGRGPPARPVWILGSSRANGVEPYSRGPCAAFPGAVTTAPA